MEYSVPDERFFQRPAMELAPALIGCLVRKGTSSGPLSGVIVETEAYTSDDPASHSYSGMTRRNRHMFLGGGLAYVYLIYGIHNCFNVTAGLPGSGQAVLVRAVRPLEGVELMRNNRGVRELHRLCSGPGRLCQAFGIDRSHSGSSLTGGEVRIMVPLDPPRAEISAVPRVGVSSGRELLRRFFLSGSEWVSPGT